MARHVCMLGFSTCAVTEKPEAVLRVNGWVGTSGCQECCASLRGVGGRLESGGVILQAGCLNSAAASVWVRCCAT